MMANDAVEQRTPGRARTLTRQEARALLDRRARHDLGMSGDHFVRAWDAGKLDGDPSRPEVLRVAMPVPLGW